MKFNIIIIKFKNPIFTFPNIERIKKIPNTEQNESSDRELLSQWGDNNILFKYNLWFKEFHI